MNERERGPGATGPLSTTYFMVVAALAVVLVFTTVATAADPPRRSGDRPRALAYPFGLYDDFDGHGALNHSSGAELAEAGALTPALWSGSGEVVAAAEHLSDAGGRGEVLRLALEAGGGTWTSLQLRNPHRIPLGAVYSLRAEMLLPADATTSVFGSGLQVTGTLQGYDDDYWRAGVDIGRDENGDVRIWGCCTVTGTPDSVCHELAAATDTWYDLRVDLTPTRGEELEVALYVDGEMLHSAVVESGDVLLERESFAWGPVRQFGIWRDDAQGEAVVYVDNVRAVYGQAVPNTQMVYDDFDGHGGYREVDDTHLAVSGELSEDLWSGEGVVAPASGWVDDSEGHENVLVLEVDDGWTDATLANPNPVPMAEVRTLSSDVLIPSQVAGAEGGWVGQTLKANLTGYDDDSWSTSVVMGRGETTPYICGDWLPVGGGEPVTECIQARYDRWYNLRIDLWPSGDDAEVRLYVDDVLLNGGRVADGAVLFDSSRISWGPVRYLAAWSDDSAPTMTALVDTVRATYHRTSLLDVSPASLLQGEQVEVTLTGEGFRKGSVPYSRSWGLSFTDVEVMASSLMRTTAVAHPKAAAGPREVVVAAGPGDRSNPVTVNVSENGALAPPAGRLGLYDDFDGHGGYHPADDSHLAVAGELSPELWDHSGTVDVVAATDELDSGSGRGNVARMQLAGPDQTWGSLTLANPAPIPVEMIGSYSADVLVPSTDSERDWSVSLELGGHLDELDEYWRVGISLSRNSDGTVWISGGWHDLVADESVGEGFEGETDRWYTLRMDVAKLENEQVLISLFVDNRLLFSGVPEQSAELIDSAANDGLSRYIGLWAESAAGDAAAYVDNVHGVYERLIVSGISPASGLQGQDIPVTITGDGFRDGLIPFSTEWGVSFVDIEVVDARTIHATALIDELAPPGEREVVVGMVPTPYSGAIAFQINRDPTLAAGDFIYGMYEDFEDPDNEGEWDLGHSDKALVWWSVGHPETYPVVIQKDGRLEISTQFDGEEGYWLSMRLAEPEGFMASENPVLRIARSIAVEFFIPDQPTGWWGPGIGFQGRYNPPEYRHIRWDLEMRLSGADEPTDFVCRVGRLYHDFDGYMTYETENEVHVQAGFLDGSRSLQLRCDTFFRQNQLVADFFVDGILVARFFPDDSAFLLDDESWCRGPVRMIFAGAPATDGTFRFYMDNLKAVYPQEWDE